jgi:hypothetical protein
MKHESRIIATQDEKLWCHMVAGGRVEIKTLPANETHEPYTSAVLSRAQFESLVYWIRGQFAALEQAAKQPQFLN